MPRPLEFYTTQLHDYLAANGEKLTFIGTYTKAKEHSLFRCNKCGYQFKAMPNGILRGQGCPDCAGRRWTKEKLQDHLDGQGKTILLTSEYAGTKEQIGCTCRVCNYSWQSTPSNLRNGGCPSCSGKLKGSIPKLQSRIDAIGSKVIVSGGYINKWTHVDCYCQICSFEWRAQPSALARGTSCPCCAPCGFNPSKPAHLYYLRVVDNGQTYWKVGITGKAIKYRYFGSDMKKITVLYSYLFENGQHAYVAEQNILKMYKDYRVVGIDVLRGRGNTEIFFADILQMDHLGGDK